MEKNNWTYTIIVVALIIVLAIVNVTKFETLKTNEQPRTIVSSGTAFEDVEPNKVEINFAVETSATNAQEAQTNNAALINNAKTSLKNLGISEKDIDTTYYQVFPEYDYTKPYQAENKIKGYKALHNIKVTSLKVADAGKIIDTLSAAGVNRIDSIQFGLDEKKIAEIKSELIAIASEDARTKAENLASGTGTRITGVMTVSEYSNDYPQYKTLSGNYLMAAEASAPRTDISPGEVRVTANVNVVYEIA